MSFKSFFGLLLVAWMLFPAKQVWAQQEFQVLETRVVSEAGQEISWNLVTDGTTCWWETLLPGGSGDLSISAIHSLPEVYEVYHVASLDQGEYRGWRSDDVPCPPGLEPETVDQNGSVFDLLPSSAKVVWGLPVMVLLVIIFLKRKRLAYALAGLS
jgi:hypothetical protein